MTKEEAINVLIQGTDTNKISDGYHTFGELYEHRIQLWIALCRNVMDQPNQNVWRSKKHSDGTNIDGWFIVGITTRRHEQLSYHLPISKWNDCHFIEEHERAPEWDGHTSEDMLQRLRDL